jgi:hypothetical protein
MALVAGLLTARESDPLAASDARAADSGRSWFLAWLAFLPIAVLRAGTLAEADTFWQIRTGQLAISHRAIPRVDPFSWTVPGKPWTLNSWGFDVLIAGVYRLAGLPGVALACAGLTMIIVGLVLLLARQLGASPFVTGVLLLLLAWLLLTEWLSARPQLADYAAVLLLTILMRRIVAGRNPIWPVTAVGIVSVVWVNLHAGELFGLAMTCACAVLLLARRDMRGGGWCLVAGAMALACSFLNPYGVGVLKQAAQVQSASSGVMVEWQHLNPADPLQLAAFAVGLTALTLALRRRDLVFAGGLGIAAAGSIFAIRFLPFLVLLALPVLAVSASRPRVLSYLHSRRIVFYLGLAAVTVMALLSLGHVGRPNPAHYSLNLVRAIPPHCRLFDTDTLGGFVILERPDVPVSLDTRNDLYGRQRVLADAQLVAGKGDIASGLAGAGCVLVPPSTGLAKWLRANHGWKLAASDSTAVLYVRAQHSWLGRFPRVGA